MYGEIPRATIEKFSSVPPENMFSSPRNWFEFRKVSNPAASIPGTVICAATRKMLIHRTKNSRLLRSCFIFQILRTVSHIKYCYAYILPPAAIIFSAAVFDTEQLFTVTAFAISPFARIFTGLFGYRTKPLLAKVFGVTTSFAI